VKHIGVLTSGGDAPGMNAAIRAVVRTAHYRGVAVSGIYRGYQGLIEGAIEEMGPRSVANIIQRGGTILRTARSQAFMTAQGRTTASEKLSEHGVDGLVVIGGDGTLRGAHALASEHGVRLVGLPGTIDNDLYGTDVSIGFNTAINIALDAVDRLRDTAASHDRLVLVEVMGRRSGHIALTVGVAGGAESILIPERPFDLQELIRDIQDSETRGKSSSIIVVAEGAYEGGALALAKTIERECKFEVRASILGHIQRGGSASTRDRVLASRLGYVAVNSLLAGETDVMVGIDGRDTRLVPLPDTWEKDKPIDEQLYELARVLAV
jgi:6-phosphofructokinase 1